MKSQNNIIPKATVFITIILIATLAYKVILAKNETTNLKIAKEQILNLSLIEEEISDISTLKITDRNENKFRNLLAIFSITFNKIAIVTAKIPDVQVEHNLNKIKKSIPLLKKYLKKISDNDLLIKNNDDSLRKITFSILNKDFDFDFKNNLIKNLIAININGITVPKYNNEGAKQNFSQQILDYISIIETKKRLLMVDNMILKQMKDVNMSFNIRNLLSHFNQMSQIKVQETYLIILLLFAILFFMSILAIYLIFAIQKRNNNLEKDIKERTIQLEERIKTEQLKLNLDILTKTYNKRYFFNDAKQEYKNALEKNISTQIAMCDVDFFRNINETYGHEAADEILVQLPNILKSCIKSDSLIIARFKEDEFAIMNFKQSNTEFKVNLQNAIETVALTKLNYKSISFNFTISIGFVTIEKNSETSLDEAVSLAEQGLFLSKTSGRNKLTQAIHEEL